MAEPEHSHNLTPLVLDEPERDLLERLIVTHAPAMTEEERAIALSVWERLSTDTVTP